MNRRPVARGWPKAEMAFWRSRIVSFWPEADIPAVLSDVCKADLD